VNTPACPYPVRPRLVLKNFVLDTSSTKISLNKTPHKKLKFKNSRTGFGQKILLCRNDPKIQRIICRNTAEICCPGHVQDKNFKDKPGTDRIRTKSRVDQIKSLRFAFWTILEFCFRLFSGYFLNQGK